MPWCGGAVLLFVVGEILVGGRIEFGNKSIEVEVKGEERIRCRICDVNDQVLCFFNSCAGEATYVFNRSRGGTLGNFFWDFVTGCSSMQNSSCLALDCHVKQYYGGTG